MFVPVGKGVFIPAERIHSILPENFIQFRKIKKIYQGIDIITQAEEEESGEIFIKGSTSLIDATYGKGVKTVIYMDSGQIILTPLATDKVLEKVRKGRR
ncbi:DUF370 domain-containing protein [Petrotoga sp. 9PWA.NaAc.5.4]|uniref:DUF370 domain-containing protein n=1 Tax=Petrotoga sp. 9PWA.NaAc.5.4 TaxID=1434328 RepID=UPI000CB9CC00|nr:DUF370 domain-containing protein [Petrotoga sp. 9PWA.NaAc.5.4]PNR93712.1 hypothetical protein X924_07805 [Petrotoga sp. 9PWA.NaAc.5.4]